MHGITAIVEHTHGHPLRTAHDLADKRAHPRARTHVDYGLAAHLWPGQADQIRPLWDAGISFFKIFTCTTHGLPGHDLDSLHEAFHRLSAAGAPCLVHCEDERMTADAERLLRAAGRDDPGLLVEWRSREAELVAVGVAGLLAERSGVRATAGL